MPDVPQDLRATARPIPRRSLLRFAWPVLGAALLGAVGGVAVAAAIHMPRVDALADYTPSLVTQLYDTAAHVYRTFARERRVMLKEERDPARHPAGGARLGGQQLLPPRRRSTPMGIARAA